MGNGYPPIDGRYVLPSAADMVRGRCRYVAVLRQRNRLAIRSSPGINGVVMSQADR
jgi:hypothetical protein